MKEGSILVGLSVVPSSGGRDLREFADDITAKVLFLFHHTRYKIGVEKIYICYRQSGEEALGETIGLIE